MAGLPDSTFGKWVGFLSGLIGLGAVIVPAIKGVISADYVLIAIIVGVVIGGLLFYRHRNIRQISAKKWFLKVRVTFLLLLAWLGMVSIGDPEIMKNIELANKLHSYVIEFFQLYSILSSIIVGFLSYLFVDMLLSLIFSR